MTTPQIIVGIVGVVARIIHFVCWIYMGVWLTKRAAQMMQTGVFPPLDDRAIKAITLLLGSGVIWGLCGMALAWQMGS